MLEMKVPSPGESITEVEIAEWLVQDGDYVEKDQAIAEVDSDKATLELPAEASGIITLKAEEGDAVAVGAVVCLIDTTAAKPEGTPDSTDSPDAAQAPAKVAATQTPAATKESYATGTPSPAAKRFWMKSQLHPQVFLALVEMVVLQSMMLLMQFLLWGLLVLKLEGSLEQNFLCCAEK